MLIPFGVCALGQVIQEQPKPPDPLPYIEFFQKFPAPLVYDTGMYPGILPKGVGGPETEWTAEALDLLASRADQVVERQEGVWLVVEPERAFRSEPTSGSDIVWRAIRDNMGDAKLMLQAPRLLEELPPELAGRIVRTASYALAPAGAPLAAALVATPRLRLIPDEPPPATAPPSPPFHFSARLGVPTRQSWEEAFRRNRVQTMPQPIQPGGAGPVDYTLGRLERLGSLIGDYERRTGFRLYADKRVRGTWVYIQGRFTDDELGRALLRVGSSRDSHLLAQSFSVRIQEAQALEGELIRSLLGSLDGSQLELLSEAIGWKEGGDRSVQAAGEWFDKFGVSAGERPTTGRVSFDIGWSLIIGWQTKTGVDTVYSSIERRARS